MRTLGARNGSHDPCTLCPLGVGYAGLGMGGEGGEDGGRGMCVLRGGDGGTEERAEGGLVEEGRQSGMNAPIGSVGIRDWHDLILDCPQWSISVGCRPPSMNHQEVEHHRPEFTLLVAGHRGGPCSLTHNPPLTLLT